MKVVKWGIVGYGEQLTKRMLPAFKKIPEIEISAVCCSKEERAEQAEKELGVRGYSKFSEFLSNSEIEVVYIATPHHLHVPQTFKAVDAGKNVLVEKPIALSVDGAHKLIEAVKRKGLKLGVNFPLRHHPALQELKEKIKTNELGEPTQVYIYLSRKKIPEQNWWRDQFHAGPMCLMDLGIQGIDLVIWLLGRKAQELSVLGLGGKDDESLNRAVIVSVNFEGDNQGIVNSSNLGIGGHNLVIVQRADEQILVEMNWPEGDGIFKIRTKTEGKVEEKKFDALDLYQLSLWNFNQAVKGGQEYSPDLDQTYLGVEVCCCAIESLKSGKVVKVGEVLRVTGSRFKE